VQIIERVARVLAGQHYSRNAHGEGPSGVPAADLVDLHWRDYTDDALAVLRTLREPEAEMCTAGAAAGGDAAAIWEAMVRAAIDGGRD
jgi:hypothetical protein